MQKSIYYKKSKIYETTNNPIQNVLRAFEMDTAPFSYEIRKAIEKTFFRKKNKRSKKKCGSQKTDVQEKSTEQNTKV